MKTNRQLQIQPRRLGRTLNLFTATILALGCLAPAAWGNGAAYYLDPNGGDTAGFDVGSGTYAQSSVQWISSSTGSGTDVAFPTASPYYQMTFGNGGTSLPDLSGQFTVTLDTTRFHGIAVNSSGIDVTIVGSGNYYNSSSGDTWTVVAGSSLTMNPTRQQFDAGATASLKGLNWNSQPITFTNAGTSGGTINFQTPMGCNDGTGKVLTENMPGGTINFLMGSAAPSGAGTYVGGFTLQAGTLNFASAGSANQFYGFTAGNNFTINGGTVDNTSGTPLTLNFAGGGGISLGGNFTFTGSSSLDFGTAAVTNKGNNTITVSASTLAIGGVISGNTAGNSLTKVGNGTLLLYGANTYTGNTIVNAGTLALTNAGSLASSAQVAVNGANLDLSGLASGSTTLTAYSPTNSTLSVALASTVTNVVAAALNVGGTTNIINIVTLPLVTGYPVTFHIVNGVTVNGTLNFGLGSVPSSSPPFIGYITNRADTGSVDFVLTGGPVPVRTLTWSGLSGGTPNGTWDVGSTPTWLDASSAPTTYNQLDIVTFNDTAAGQTAVNLSGLLTPGSLTVSNDVLTYAFTGGELSDGSGSLSLNKQGTGTLLLQESGDNFSGNIVAGAGTVIIDNDSSGITGGTVIGAGATVQLGTNDTAGVLPAGTVTANGTLVFNRADNITVANNISGGGSVSEINSNIVTLSGTSSGNWSLMIQNGTVQAVNNTSLGALPGGTVTITNGGTFDVGANSTQNNANFGAKLFTVAGTGVGGNGVIVNSGAVQQQDAFQNLVLGADATFGGANRWDLRGGTPILNLAGYTLTKTNANQISMVSPHVTSGNIIIQQGILSFESTPNFDASAGTITVNSGGYVGQYKDTVGSFTRPIVLNGGGTTNLSGNGSITFLDAPITLTANSTLGSSGGTEIFNGVISDGGNGFSLSTAGTGTNLLSATNTYTGITSVQGTLGLTNRGSISGTPLIIVTNGGAFDISGLSVPFSGTNVLWVGDDVLGQGTFTLGSTPVTNFNYISISNAVLQMAVVNSGAPCITVTNLNLGDGVGCVINLTGLPLLPSAQFPLIKYTSVSGTYNVSLGSLPNGYAGNLVNNTANNSIDLAITALPSGIWNGGSSTDNNWTDAANWNGTGLSGSDALNFTGTARLNNTNDLSETANYLAFLPGAGAFILNGNPVTLAGGVTNGSSNPQTIDLGLIFGSSVTNITLDGGTAGLIIGGGLTNSFGAPGYAVLTLNGTGTVTNLLNSSTSPGGTNILLMSNAGANWTLVDNTASAPITVPWDFQINAGTFNFGFGASAPTLTNSSAQGLPQDNQVGAVSGAVGTLNISNGTWTTIARLNTALASYSTGIVNQAGGTLNIGNQFQGANAATTNAQSIVNVSGGTMNINAGAGQFYVSSRDQGSLTVSGTATVNCGTLDVARNANGNTRGSVGVVNLNGGVLSVSRVGTATANSQAGPPSSGFTPSATFNFNGGTLLANAGSTNYSTNFFQGSPVAPIIPITAIVKERGAIIDDGGFAITMLEPLQHDATLGATPDGGFIKNGAGTNTLTAASTYTGPTVANNGTLVVNGSLTAVSTVTVAPAATLSGTGVIGGSVTVNGTITPGNPGTNGLLTCSADVTLNGASTMKLDKIKLTNDVLVVGGNLAYGGTLNVAVLSGAPAANDSFKLFSAASYSGNFAVTNLPSLTGGLAWDWNPANGTLSVVSGVNPNPTNITATISGGILTLTWPADHTGWTLQAQTNVLGAGLDPNAGTWFNVPGSPGVNSVQITIDPSQPTVFYRLKL